MLATGTVRAKSYSTRRSSEKWSLPMNDAPLDHVDRVMLLTEGAMEEEVEAVEPCPGTGTLVVLMSSRSGVPGIFFISNPVAVFCGERGVERLVSWDTMAAC